MLNKRFIVMKATKTPLLGWAFNDVLNELHQLVFHGLPGETEPFELSELEREYIAFVLACYYQCGRCMEFHERAVDLARRKAKTADWDWKKEMINATLFLHLDGRKLSALEWEHWSKAWAAFNKRIHARHPGLAHYIAYAVGIARNDRNLMDHAFCYINEHVEDDHRLKGIIRDIDGVVIFMKAATSKNRSDATIIEQLKSRGIEDV